MMYERFFRPAGCRLFIVAGVARSGACAAVVLFLLSGVSIEVRAQEDHASAALVAPVDLEEELQRVRASLSERRQELASRNQELVARQAELEREDPIAKGLREKMVEHQREVEALRRSLKARLEAIEEIQVLEAARREVIDELQQLALQEREVSEAVRNRREEAETRRDDH